jgi:hypothetical protein
VEELGIDGMAEMYQELAKAGVAGYHFVSNSPNELQQVIGKPPLKLLGSVENVVLTSVWQSRSSIIMVSPMDIPSWYVPSCLSSFRPDALP